MSNFFEKIHECSIDETTDCYVFVRDLSCKTFFVGKCKCGLWIGFSEYNFDLIEKQGTDEILHELRVIGIPLE